MLNYHVPTLFNNFLNIIADEQGNANAVTYEWDFPGVVPVLTHKSSLYSSKSIAGPNSFGLRIYHGLRVSNYIELDASTLW